VELLKEGQTPAENLKEVLQFWLELPPTIRHNHDFIWVLSKATMESLAGYELEDAEMDGSYMDPSGAAGPWGPWLVGKPIRRDDTAVGLKYEAPPSKYAPLMPGKQGE